jgi:hypothetical protein
LTDPIFPKFLQKTFLIRHNDTAMSLSGLLSTNGITRIYSKDVDEAKILAMLVGKLIQVRLGDHDLQGVLERQFSESGAFFEVRFVNLAPTALAEIQANVNASGGAPGWHRNHPRVPVELALQSNLVVPSLCIIKTGKGEHYLNVVNFTLGGVRLETMNDVLSEVKVGEKLAFDLLTSLGEFISGLEGEVRNIGTHHLRDKSVMDVKRSFGIKLGQMSYQNDKKYKAIIKNLCESLKKSFDFEE